MSDAVKTTPLISEEERVIRKATIDFARRSVRHEGIMLSEEIEALNEKYINGELTLQEHTQAGLDLLKRKKPDGWSTTPP